LAPNAGTARGAGAGRASAGCAGSFAVCCGSRWAAAAALSGVLGAARTGAGAIAGSLATPAAETVGLRDTGAPLVRRAGARDGSAGSASGASRPTAPSAAVVGLGSATPRKLDISESSLGWLGCGSGTGTATRGGAATDAAATSGTRTASPRGSSLRSARNNANPAASAPRPINAFCAYDRLRAPTNTLPANTLPANTLLKTLPTTLLDRGEPVVRGDDPSAAARRPREVSPSSGAPAPGELSRAPT
jgi:hypothetical protein